MSEAWGDPFGDNMEDQWDAPPRVREIEDTFSWIVFSAIALIFDGRWWAVGIAFIMLIAGSGWILRRTFEALRGGPD